MKILIDIGHPAHVHYFRNLIRIMEAKGHQFLVIARDKEITHQLLSVYKIPYLSRGKGSSNIIGKITYVLKADLFILKHARKFKPDILMSFGSPYAAHVSKLINKPHLGLTDTEHAKLGILAFAPFTERIITPDVFEKDFGKKHVRFRSYIEYAYLHPKYFISSPTIRSELDIKADQKFALLRFISWGASHDIGQKGISSEIRSELIKLLEQKDYKVLISSEAELEAKYKPYQVKISPHKIHDVLAAADLFIGESGTMATEAAILGTPSVFVNSLDAGVFKDEVKHKVLYSYRNSDQLLKNIDILTSDKELKSKHFKYKEQLIKEKIDPTEYLVDLLDTYLLR